MGAATGLYTSLVPPKPKPAPDLKTIDEAATAIGRDPDTVYRWLRRGLITRYYRRIGRRRTMVDMAELRRLLENPPSERARD